jgi:nitrate/nitrite transporter NarK
MPTFFKEQFKLDQGAAGISATSFLAVAMFRRKARRRCLGGSLEPHE